MSDAVCVALSLGYCLAMVAIVIMYLALRDRE